jgi:hypothetical protein
VEQQFHGHCGSEALQRELEKIKKKEQSVWNSSSMAALQRELTQKKNSQCST